MSFEFWLDSLTSITICKKISGIQSNISASGGIEKLQPKGTKMTARWWERTGQCGQNTNAIIIIIVVMEKKQQISKVKTSHYF